MGNPDILNVTQDFFSPEWSRRFSNALERPVDKVHADLRAAIPTFLSGLINKGSTRQGAEELLHMVEEEKFKSEIPINFNDAHFLSKGEHAIDDIFDDYHAVAKRLMTSTGMQPFYNEKLLEMIAPIVLGVLGKKIKEENMTPDNLSGYLQDQKKVLRGFNTNEDKNYGPSHILPSEDRNKRIPFLLVAALLIGGLLLSFWFLSKQSRSIATLTKDISSVHTASTTSSEVAGAELEMLPSFLKEGTREKLPNRFILRDTSFILGSTDLGISGDQELDFIAQTLQNFPRSTVRIDAYIENTGDPEENLLLSENRAMLIREELIGRGVEPSRIRAAGKGPEIGRGQVELVVTKIK